MVCGDGERGAGRDRSGRPGQGQGRRKVDRPPACRLSEGPGSPTPTGGTFLAPDCRHPGWGRGDGPQSPPRESRRSRAKTVSKAPLVSRFVRTGTWKRFFGSPAPRHRDLFGRAEGGQFSSSAIHPRSTVGGQPGASLGFTRKWLENEPFRSKDRITFWSGTETARYVSCWRLRALTNRVIRTSVLPTIRVSIHARQFRARVLSSPAVARGR